MADQRGGVVGEAVGDRRRSRRRHGYLAVSLVLTALYPALPGTLREVVLVAACAAAITCVVIGRRTVEPGRRAPWTFLIGALAMYLGANALIATHDPEIASAGRLLDAAANLLALAASLAMILRRGARDLGGIADAAVIALAAGTVLWAVLPRRLDSDSGLIAQVDLFVVVFALSGVLGALLRLTRTATNAGTALWWLLATISLGIAGNVTSSVGAATPAAAKLAGTIFMGTFTAIGMFGLDPSAPRLMRAQRVSNAEELSVGRLIFLGAAVAAVPAVIGIQAALGGNPAAILLALQGVLVAAVVMIRIRLLANQRARAEQALAHQATHDALTQLPNRREFMTRLSAELSRGTPCAILFCDLDEFKAVNDRFGHDAGDRLLIEVADLLRTRIDGPHVVSRFGGDEFVVLLVDISPEQAQAVRDRVAATLDRPFAAVDGARLSVSTGLACTEGHSDPEELLKRADHAMYQDKTRRKARPRQDR